ncbi:MAG: HAD family hydrolase [Xanthomonadales bacterium]|nr:HAD family hydrolase [Xanthomonadales bacterium]MDH4018990.1 HAD family hydrolase [Xanthomonadales bacterium]
MVISKPDIKVIGFDADDTLWMNEEHYRETEDSFVAMMEPWLTERETRKHLFAVEMENLGLYGYGAKGFTLSMISAANSISNGQASSSLISEIIELGKTLIDAPMDLLPGVSDVLETLHGDYRMIVATKGDLLDQERKLKKSNLEDYFHHVEIMSDKNPESYRKLVRHLDIKPEEFLMIGNSLKSDVVPVLDIGADAIHIPAQSTWAHEHVDDTSRIQPYLTLDGFGDLIEVFYKQSS